MKVILITGGSRGIGAATAKICAARGMGVILTYQHRADAAAAVVSKIAAVGGKAVALSLDIGEMHSFPAFRDRVAQVLRGTWQAERLYGLVNNAGLGMFTPFSMVTEAQFDTSLAIHLKGPFFLTQTLLPLIADGGAIVNLTSAVTRLAVPGLAPYASFKGGLEILTRYLAKELGERGIRANAVSPGAIRTEIGGGLTEEYDAALSAQTALGRVGEADDVGRVVASLLSDEMGWVNAQSIEVSGGYVI